MRPGFATQRRAEAFHASVEGAVEGTAPESEERFTDLLELVAALRAEPEVPARPEFVADLRAQLMAAAQTALAPAPEVRTPTPRRSPRERRLAVAVGGFAIVSATASMSVAAQSALPGDTLYPLKRAIENIQTGVQRGDDDKGATMLDNASGRLSEVDELTRSDDRDPEVIAQTLRDFTEQATEASDLLLADYAENGSEGSIRELRDFAAESSTSLEALADAVPAEARDPLVEAVRVLDRIERMAVRACPACSDLQAAAASLSEALELTPLDALLDPAPGEGAPAADDEPAGDPDPPPAAPPEVEETTPPATATDDPLDDPEPPALPVPGSDDEDDSTGGDRGDNGAKGGKGGKGKNPLEPITTGLASDDPLGGLLEGAGEALDDTLGGLLGGSNP